MIKSGTAALWCGLALVTLGRAAAPEIITSRIVPTRPALVPHTTGGKPLTWVNVGGLDYISSVRLAEFLELKSGWLEQNHKLLLTDKTTRIQLERDRVESQVNGLGVRLGNAPIFRDGALLVSRIDFERYLLPRIRPDLLGPVPPRPRIIVIDPGHGGKDNGMENGKLGLKEKVLALDVALRLKKMLEGVGLTVVLTRTADVAPIYKDLPMRAKIANDAHADLFVSIHFNSLFPDTKTSGTETYWYTPQFQRSTSSQSAGQPDDARREPVPVNQWDRWSALLADHVQRDVLARLNTADRGQKTKHLLVLQDLNCPAVLIESLFLSNDGEARRAAVPKFRQEIATAIFAGIQGYVLALEELRPPQIVMPATSAPSPASVPNRSP